MLKTAKQKEMTRLTKVYHQCHSAAIMCAHYGDAERSNMYAFQAAQAREKMARIRRFGMPSKKARKQAVRKFDAIYGPCEVLRV